MNISELVTNKIEVNSIGFLVGTVSFFARSSAPTGWLKCNGAAIGRTDYAELFDSIGTTYGSGDYSTTFNLPDLRGEFVRCWDDGRGVDAGRPLTSILPDASPSIVYTQDWAVQRFTGNFPVFLDTYDVTPRRSGIFNNSAYSREYRLASDGFSSGWQDVTIIYVDSSAQIKSSTETRPRNVALLACIKY